MLLASEVFAVSLPFDKPKRRKKYQSQQYDQYVQRPDIFFSLAMWPYLGRRPLKYSSNGVTGVIIFTVANTVSKMF